VRTALGIDETDAEADALRKLESGAQALFDARAAEIVPYLATVLSLPLAPVHEQRVKFLDAAAIKRQVFLSMRQLFQRLVQRQPTLVVLEDWHWVDQSSIALCEHLLPLAEDHALTFWLSTRAEPAEPAARVGIAARALPRMRCNDIALPLLGPEHSRTLIDNLIGASTLPEPVRDQIQRRTEGNPFFIEEVLRAFIAEGTLVEDKRAAGGWRLTRPTADVAIPATVQGVIVARIDRLDEDVKNVLKLASVIGRSFLLRVLKAIADSGDAVEPALGRLEEGELVRVLQRVPEVEYNFKHALVQEAAYDSILTERRRAIHRSVAQAIESLFPDRTGEFASLLAYHYARAQDWAKAQTFLLAAGDQAGRMAADAEALEHYRQAEATFMKVAAREFTALQRATMDRKLGQAFYGVGNHADAVAHFSRALAHLGITYPTSRRGVRRGIAGYLVAHFVRRAIKGFARPNIAVEVAQEVSAICESLVRFDYFIDETRFALDGLIGLDVGERSADLLMRSRGLAMLGGVLMVFGWRGLAARRIAESVSLAAEIGQPAALAGPLFVRAWLDWTSGGSLDDAIAAFEQSAAAYEAIGDVRSAAGATSQLVWVLARRNRFERVASLSSKLIRVGQEANDPHVESWGMVCLANWGLSVGPLEEAVQRIERARSLSQRISSPRMYANAGAVLAKCLLRQGRLAQARVVLDESLGILNARGMSDLFFIESITAYTELCLLDVERLPGAERRRALRAAKAGVKKARACAGKAAVAWRAEVLRLQGTLAWLCGARPVALRHWHASLEAAEQMALPIDRARGWLEMGSRTGNAGLVEDAQRLFESMGARVDLALSLHARARLAAASGADVEPALHAYASALAALESVQAEYDIGLACRERAQLLAARGQREAARGDWIRARARFEAVGANAERDQADRDIVALG
jgi:tetratricopeptide (TPR) repeat protein